MDAIHGASPSGGEWRPVDGRDLWPELEPGRLDAAEAVRLPFWCDDPGRTAEEVDVLRPVGAPFLGTRDFGGEFSSLEEVLFELPGGVIFDPSRSVSSKTWLLMLGLRTCRAYCISSKLPLQFWLPARLRGRGESLSVTVCGTGTGLTRETGIREVLGRTMCCRWFCCSWFCCSSATSAGDRISESRYGSNSVSCCGTSSSGAEGTVETRFRGDSS